MAQQHQYPEPKQHNSVYSEDASNKTGLVELQQGAPSADFSTTESKFARFTKVLHKKSKFYRKHLYKTGNRMF